MMTDERIIAQTSPSSINLDWFPDPLSHCIGFQVVTFEDQRKTGAASAMLLTNSQVNDSHVSRSRALSGMSGEAKGTKNHFKSTNSGDYSR